MHELVHLWVGWNIRDERPFIEKAPLNSFKEIALFDMLQIEITIFDRFQITL